MALELLLVSRGPVAPGLRLADVARCVELPRAAMAADWERERESAGTIPIIVTMRTQLLQSNSCATINNYLVFQDTSAKNSVHEDSLLTAALMNIS